jgi:hypothetical protein
MLMRGSLDPAAGAHASATKHRPLGIGPCLMRSISRALPPPEDPINRQDNQPGPLTATCPMSETATGDAQMADEPCSAPLDSTQSAQQPRKKRKGSTELQQLLPSQRRRVSTATPQDRHSAAVCASSREAGRLGQAPEQGSTCTEALPSLISTPLPGQRLPGLVIDSGAGDACGSLRQALPAHRAYVNPLLLNLPCRPHEQPAATRITPVTPTLCR